MHWRICPCTSGERPAFTAFMTMADPTYPKISQTSVMRSVEEHADQTVKSIRCTIPQDPLKTDVSLTCDMWSSIVNVWFLIATLHWLDEKWDMQTIILGTMKSNVEHTKNNISKAMLKVRSKFDIFSSAEFIEKCHNPQQVIGETFRI